MRLLFEGEHTGSCCFFFLLCSNWIEEDLLCKLCLRYDIKLRSCTIPYLLSCCIIAVAYCLYSYPIVCSRLSSCLRCSDTIDSNRKSHWVWLKFNLQLMSWVLDSCLPACPPAGPDSVLLWRHCEHLPIVVQSGATEALCQSGGWRLCYYVTPLASSPSVHLLSAWHRQLGCINWLLLIVFLLCIISLCGWDQSGVRVCVCVCPWMPTVFNMSHYNLHYEGSWTY